MSDFSSSIDSLAQQYVHWDPNAETRAAISQLREQQKYAELQQLLSKRLQFGTAGLRGPMGPGYNRMNELVVLQTTQGLIQYIDSCSLSETVTRSVVIGYDHRSAGSLSSKSFARISAAVFHSKGFKTYLLEGFVPTPFVPFGVSHFKAAAGIMVTASHNPKADNGFKVYWNTASQIIPPHDAGIAAAIQDNLAPWEAVCCSTDEAVLSHPLAAEVTEQIAAAYYAAMVQLSSRYDAAAAVITAAAPVAEGFKCVYTAMHGVGCQWVRRAFESFQHPTLDAVPSQQSPDPMFPTVSFPNPEEKGALNEAIRYADSKGATLILANDPDADRLAVAEKQLTTAVEEQQWHVFSGNELGVLLGHWQIQKWKKTSRGSSNSSDSEICQPAVLASIVSSRMLKAVALAEGVQYHDTLTGFKWLGDRAIQLRAAGTPVLFSYEEALGYCIGDALCDKDGISAAAVFLEIALELRQQQPPLTVKQHLQHLYCTYGEFVSYNSYVLSHDGAVTDAIFHRLRSGGPHGGYWTHCAGVKIDSIVDVTKGFDSSNAVDQTSSLPVTPESHMIMYCFENGCSVTLRTSGTEPKIKFYTEIAGKLGQSRAEASAVLHSFVDKLVDEMLQPEANGLQRA